MSTPAPGDVRSAVENLLGAYARLCDQRDTTGLGDLLARAELRFRDAEPVSSRDSIAKLYDRAFAAGHETRHLLSNIEVTQPATGGDRSGLVAAHAYYTRWVLDPAPRLVGIGRYTCSFMLHDGTWEFATHTVHRDWYEEA